MFGSTRKTLAAIGLSAGFLALSTAASAGCLQDFNPEATIQQESWQGIGKAHLMPVDYHQQYDIVGLWNVTVTYKGQVIDYGLQQWHGDGTEFTNSSMQHPLTQNYCVGVWERTSETGYKLNHFAYNYNDKQEITGLVRIIFEVNINSEGDRYSGSYTVYAYDKQRNLLATVPAHIVGTRIKVDTPATEIR